MSFSEWLAERELSVEDITGRKEDLQAAAIFPVVEDKEQMGTVLRWMVSEPGLTEGKAVWLESRRLSADEISAQADLRLLYAQRESFCKGNWEVLARNHAKSVFYQLDLMDVAGEFHKFGIDKPEVLPTVKGQSIKNCIGLMMSVHRLRSWTEGTSRQTSRPHSTCCAKDC